MPFDLPHFATLDLLDDESQPLQLDVEQWGINAFSLAATDTMKIDSDNDAPFCIGSGEPFGNNLEQSEKLCFGMVRCKPPKCYWRIL